MHNERTLECVCDEAAECVHDLCMNREPQAPTYMGRKVKENPAASDDGYKATTAEAMRMVRKGMREVGIAANETICGERFKQ